MGIELFVTTSVVNVLEQQHREIATLFEQVSDPERDRPAVLHRLLKEMAAHVAAERSQIQPIVKRREIGGEDLSDRLLSDYDRMEKLMVLIERRKFNSPDVPELLTQLKDVTAEHISRADAELFPGLEANLTAEEQRDLAERVDHADDMVMSHPHPHLLSLGPIAGVITRVMSRFDWLRDRTVNNRHPEGDDPSMGGAT